MLKNHSIFFSALKQNKTIKPSQYSLKSPVFDMLERYPSLNPINKFALDFWSTQTSAVQKSQTYETSTCYRGICKHVLNPLLYSSYISMKIKHYLILQFLKLKLLSIQFTIESQVILKKYYC